MKELKIIMTGGGSAGHVTPNLALIPKLKDLGYKVEYIGSRDGIEKKIIEDAGINYHAISSGKLRRYFDIKNFSDPFKVIKGIWQAIGIIKQQKPDIIFSKGGFVAVPVVIGGFLNRVPIIAHESDMTPGLANRLSLPYCTKICVTFPECLKNIKKEKAVLTGTPIRKELFEGDKNAAERICGFENKKPILLIVGGSLGSTYINETIRKNIDKLLLKYNIIHICGKNNLDKTLLAKKGYKQFEYVSSELPHLLAYADFVVSRAGANLIFELLALKKPNILIPLSAKSSRGDQILNAKSFEKRGYSIVIEEENLNGSILLQKLEELDINKNNYINNMMHSELRDSTDIIVKLIVELSNKKNR